ncbi:MAG: PAS domain S-box protein [Pseudanabaena sp.]
MPKNIYVDLAIAPNFITVAPWLALRDVIRRMNQATVFIREESSDYGWRGNLEVCVLVIDHNRLMGIFTKGDVLRLIEQQVDLQEVKIVDAITHPVNTIKYSQIADLAAISGLLENSPCRYLPVIDEFEQILGLVTPQSLLLAEKQKTEDDFNNAEAQKRAILTAIPDLIYRVSVEGAYLECFSSNYVADLFPADLDVVNKHLSEVLPPELASRKLQAIKQAIATGEIQLFEQQWNIDGKVQYEEVQVVKVTDQEALTIVRNVSARKQSEAILRESEMRFRSVFDTAAVGISLATIDGQHIAGNQSLCQMLGYSEDELKVLTFQDITHPDDIDLDLYHYQKLLRDEIDSFHIEKRYRHKNGHFIWVLLSVSIVRDPQNQPLYDIALIQNISDLKLAQQELSNLNKDLEMRIQQRTADLAESETRKQQLINAIPDLLLRLKRDGTCIDYILPMIPDKEAFVPLKHHISEILSPHVLVEQLQVFDRAITTGEVQIYEHKLQKYNEWVYEEVRISPCGEDEVLVLVRNISDRKQAEEALRLSNEKLIATNKELERMTQLKDEFLATMSHELRTPLNAILGISEGLQEQVYGELNQRQQASLSTIQKSGQHLLALINDILDVAKIESGMFTLDLTSVSFVSLCESSLSFVKQQAAKKNIQLKLMIDPNLPQVIIIDERRMRQLLINLLINAVKFTPRDGFVTLEAKLAETYHREMERESCKSQLSFAVTDTGIGISPEDISKLFQPFVQINSNLSRQYAGTGLVLNLVKKLAELHGGYVTVESKVGQGSCFTVTFPYEL